ncbi:MAG: tRNA pseudouridine(38-40) synthase TruA [Leptospiraceae bacterium]|nr:tRNA pseudouridine(38-40) synthase TruA [Leptospiraceae bacterium]MDW8306342.1 tRNA pseudouridine(38-40) synthase TruA [Leptospiraceae bacterium]
MKLAFTVQYSGEGFVGFQRQKHGRTVQCELERAFSIILRHAVRIYAAGRTDSGVHALGQVIHLRTPLSENDINLPKLIYGVNSLLPQDLSIIHGAKVSDSFHARFSCLAREYLYCLLNTPYRMVLGASWCHWIRQDLDVDKMQQAAQMLLGERDFAAFTPAVYAKMGEKTRRRLDKLEVIKIPPFVYLYFRGSGFLHNMVRIITGTLVEIGQGKKKVEDMGQILSCRNRLLAGVTAPAKGLCFLRARYEEYETPEELIPPYRWLAPYI